MLHEFTRGSSAEGKKILAQTECPRCPSSDAFTIWEKADGTQDAHCFSCGAHFNPYLGDNNILTDPKEDDEKVVGIESRLVTKSAAPASRANRTRQDSDSVVTVDGGMAHPILGLSERLITKSTCERFNVRTGVSPTDGETPIYTLFPRYRDGQLIGWKRKTKEKQYSSSGGGHVDLFGEKVCKPGGKKIFITEGEEDALAIYQVLKEYSSIPGWEPDVVSLPDGCSSCTSSLTRSYEFLNQFDEIVICFDSDEPGRKARDEALKIFSGKASYVDLPLKDACDMLKAGRGEELKWALLTRAQKYQPDGIVNPADLWDRYKDTSVVQSFPYPDFLPELNYKTQGSRPGSIITITSGSGCGKTEFLIKLMHHHLKTAQEDVKLAGVFIEQDVVESMRLLISTDLGKRIQLEEVSVTEEEEKESFDRLFGSNRVTFYDYFGGMDDSNLMAKLKYLAVTGHKIIFLDHLSIIVSEFADQGGERERIDTLMTKLAKFVKEYGIVLYLVVHLVKTGQGGVPFEEGARPSLDDLRGSGSIKQLSWDVIALARNQQHEDPFTANVVEVISLKCRHTGRTGVCDYIHFNDLTGMYTKVEKPLNFHKRSKSNRATVEDF